MKEALEWIKDIGLAIIIAAVVLFFLKPIIVQQESMQPNFYEDDYLIISKQAYTLFGDEEYGDVIIFKTILPYDEGEEKFLIKRIIGVPGDTIEITNGYVFRNGEMIEEPYVEDYGVSGEMAPIVVEEGKLFVMGDNRAVSQDSRSQTIGQVDQDAVLGKVILRIFPFDRIKAFS